MNTPILLDAAGNIQTANNNSVGGIALASSIPSNIMGGMGGMVMGNNPMVCKSSNNGAGVTATTSDLFGGVVEQTSQATNTPVVSTTPNTQVGAYTYVITKPFKGTPSKIYEGLTQDDLLVIMNTNEIRNTDLLQGSRIKRVIPVPQGAGKGNAVKTVVLNDLLKGIDISVDDYEKDIGELKALATYQTQIASILVEFDKMLKEGLLTGEDTVDGVDGVVYAPDIVYAMSVATKELGQEIVSNEGKVIPKDSMLNTYLMGNSMAFLISNTVFRVIDGKIVKMPVLRGGQ